jgi:hypothetical protein
MSIQTISFVKEKKWPKLTTQPETPKNLVALMDLRSDKHNTLNMHHLYYN